MEQGIRQGRASYFLTFSLSNTIWNNVLIFYNVKVSDILKQNKYFSTTVNRNLFHIFISMNLCKNVEILKQGLGRFKKPVCCSLFWCRVGVCKPEPGRGPNILSFFINKTLLEHSQIHVLHSVLAASRAELSSWCRDHMACQPGMSSVGLADPEPGHRGTCAT